jgi:Ala-tRNA(Pro) deacylase
MDTKAVATASTAHPGLLAWLSASRVDYEIHEHAVTQTARQTARAEGVDPKTFAKVVGVRTADGRNVLLVLDATDRVDLIKARKALGLGSVRLLTETELTALAPDCETGAIPAVGALFGVPTYADHAVAQDTAISFNAGTHRCSVRVDREAWEQAAGVIYCDLAERTDLAPVWAR